MFSRQTPGINLRKFPFNFPSIPSTPTFILFLSLVALTRHFMWHHLYYVFTYIYSLLIEKGICDCRNVSIKFVNAYLFLSSGDPFIFSARFSHFILIFSVIHTSVLSLSTWSLKVNYDYLLHICDK